MVIRLILIKYMQLSMNNFGADRQMFIVDECHALLLARDPRALAASDPDGGAALGRVGPAAVAGVELLGRRGHATRAAALTGHRLQKEAALT